MLFTRKWWEYALYRAGRTSLGMMLPFVSFFVQDGNAVPMALAGGFGAITSLASSLRGLRELTGEVLPKWKAILTRCAWSLGQGVLTGFGTAAALPEVDWNAVWMAAASGVVTSFILGILSALPETDEVVTPEPPGGVDVSVEGSVTVVQKGAPVYSTNYNRAV